MDAPAKSIDWEAIEQDYRIGIKTMRQIAEEHGITHGAINKRAKRDGWSRDLSAKINARADALVSKAAVSNAVSKEKADTEQAVVEVNAQAVASVLLSHRTNIAKTRSIVMTMLEELEASCGAGNVAALTQLGEFMYDPELTRDKLNEIYQSVISLPTRAKTMQALAGSLSVLMDKERQAFNIAAPKTAAEETASPATRTLTDAERAVRLARLLKSTGQRVHEDA